MIMHLPRGAVLSPSAAACASLETGKQQLKFRCLHRLLFFPLLSQTSVLKAAILFPKSRVSGTMITNILQPHRCMDGGTDVQWQTDVLNT